MGSFNIRSKVTFDLSNGWVEADKFTVLHIANGPQTAELANEYWINSGIDKLSLNQTMANAPLLSVASGGQGLPSEQQTYDRISNLLHQGSVKDYNLVIQGGSDKSRFYLSAGEVSKRGF